MPNPVRNQVHVTLSATASSSLPVSYRSLTPRVCSVEGHTGQVTGLRTGSCSIAVTQGGDERFAPVHAIAPAIEFRFDDELTLVSPPSLHPHDVATIRVADGARSPVAYGSASPMVCTIDGSTGLVSAILPGECVVTARTEARATQISFDVLPALRLAPPSVPEGVVATFAEHANLVRVSLGALQAGGSEVQEYVVTSVPTRWEARGRTLPLEIACEPSCAGYAFAVAAVNGVGRGADSAPAHVVTDYGIVATFKEPDTQPNDTIFVGGFRLDATTGTVLELTGKLSQSMTGGASPYPNDSMTWLPLSHALSSVRVSVDGTDGLLLTTFLLPTTDTLSKDPAYGGTDGFSPGTGLGLHDNYPGAHLGNAYARVFINTQDPTIPLTPSQIGLLAYADCTPSGLMGATCMTATTVEGYGVTGTMSGFPVSQVVAKR